MTRFYADPVYKKFRLDVLKRDRFRCKMPGCKNKKDLQVHHITKWSGASSLRYETSNGITLCKHCHRTVTGKESHYESLFRELIR